MRENKRWCPAQGHLCKQLSVCQHVASNAIRDSRLWQVEHWLSWILGRYIASSQHSRSSIHSMMAAKNFRPNGMRMYYPDAKNDFLGYSEAHLTDFLCHHLEEAHGNPQLMREISGWRSQNLGYKPTQLYVPHPYRDDNLLDSSSPSSVKVWYLTSLLGKIFRPAVGPIIS